MYIFRVFLVILYYCIYFSVEPTKQQKNNNKTGGKLGLFLSPALKRGKNSFPRLENPWEAKQFNTYLVKGVGSSTRGGQEHLQGVGQGREEDLGQSSWFRLSTVDCQLPV